jgi:hypothetical protein
MSDAVVKCKCGKRVFVPWSALLSDPVVICDECTARSLEAARRRQR